MSHRIDNDYSESASSYVSSRSSSSYYSGYSGPSAYEIQLQRDREEQRRRKAKKAEERQKQIDQIVTPLKQAKYFINDPVRLYVEIQKNSDALLGSYQKLVAICCDNRSGTKLKALAAKAREDYLDIYTFVKIFKGSLENSFSYKYSWRTFTYFLQQPSCDPQRKLSQVTLRIDCKDLTLADSEALAIVFKHVTAIKLENANLETLKIIQTAYDKAGIDRTVKTIEAEDVQLAADKLKPALDIIASILSEPAVVKISYAFNSKNWIIGVVKKASIDQNKTVVSVEKAPLTDTLVDGLVTLQDALKTFQKAPTPFSTVLSNNNYIFSDQFKTVLPVLIGLCEKSIVIGSSNTDSCWIVKTDVNKTETLQFTDCAITPDIAKTCESLQKTHPTLSIVLENTQVSIPECTSVLECLQGVNGKTMSITCSEDKPNIVSVSKSNQEGESIVNFDSSTIQLPVMQAVLRGANNNCTTSMAVRFGRSGLVRFNSNEQYERVTAITFADSTIYESDTTEDKIKQRLTKNFPSLAHLDISGDIRFNGRSKQQLLVQATQCPLRALSLGGFHLEVADAALMGPILATNLTLEKLSFNIAAGVGASEVALIQLTGAIAALTQLAETIKTNFMLKEVNANVELPPILKTILKRNSILDELKAKHAAIVKYLDEFDDSTIYTSEQAEKTSSELYQAFIGLCELKNYYYLTDIQAAELDKRLNTCLGRFFEKLLTLKNPGATFSIANHLYEVIVRAVRDPELEKTVFRIMTSLSLQTTSAVEAEKNLLITYNAIKNSIPTYDKKIDSVAYKSIVDNAFTPFLKYILENTYILPAVELAVKLTHRLGDIALTKQGYFRLADAIQQELAKPEMTPTDRFGLIEKVEYLYGRLNLPEFSEDHELIGKVSQTLRICCEDVLGGAEMLIKSKSGSDYQVKLSDYCRLLTNLVHNPYAQNDLLLNTLLRANKTLILVMIATYYNLPLRGVLTNSLEKGDNEAALDFIRRIHSATSMRDAETCIGNYLRELGIFGRTWNKNLVNTLELISSQLAGIQVAVEASHKPVVAKEAAMLSPTAVTAGGLGQPAMGAAPPPTYFSVDEPPSVPIAAPAPSAPPLEEAEKNRIVVLLNKLATFKDPHALDDVPEKLKCPISLNIMRDPVIAADGHFYDRDFINTWITTNKDKGTVPLSPKTKLSLSHFLLTSAEEKRSDIIEHLQELIKIQETKAASQQMRLAPAAAGNPMFTHTDPESLQQLPMAPIHVPGAPPVPVVKMPS